MKLTDVEGLIAISDAVVIDKRLDSKLCAFLMVDENHVDKNGVNTEGNKTTVLPGLAPFTSSKLHSSTTLRELSEEIDDQQDFDNDGA